MTEKYRVTLLPDGESRFFDKGVLLIDLLADMGYPADSPCGGRGVCGKCRVKGSGRFRDIFSGIVIEHKNPAEIISCRSQLSGDASIIIENTSSTEDENYITFSPGKKAGIAVDIGTTTIQISLVDLESGQAYRQRPVINPQRRFGHDVMSRVSAVTMNPALTENLSALTLNMIAGGIKKISTAAGLTPDFISRVVFSGNTVMTYLLLGIDISPLGEYPYPISHRDFRKLDINLRGTVSESAIISAIPPASAFSGGDFISGLAVCETDGIAENSFFIDIGTNGELFISDRGGNVTASSCAMGPALEGMNISSGMTASSGAVNGARIEKGALKLSVIGEAEPVGICGTGLIDLISIALDRGIIDSRGTVITDKKPETPVHEGFAVDKEKRIIHLQNGLTISQKDIRNLQLAKGASLAASRIIMKRADLNADEIKRVIIAGALGENLNQKNFRRLSFLPEFKNAEWISAGNTSLRGAETACVDPGFIDLCYRIAESISIIDLAADSSFNDEFIKALDFSKTG